MNINNNNRNKNQKQQWALQTTHNKNAHIPQAPTLLENAVYNEWQFQTLVTGNRREKTVSSELHKIILAKVQKGYELLL